MTDRIVYRLMPRAEWEGAQARGVAPWNDDDARDGFFHLSTRTQVGETARRHYAGVAELWVLEIDAAALGDVLKWEASRGGALFPHYYGEAPLSAVVAAAPFDPDDFSGDVP